VESPLTPLDFARRTRRLHGSREAVVDGDLRLSYEQFFDRCDRWSSALAGLGVRPGDRVATIAPTPWPGNASRVWTAPGKRASALRASASCSTRSVEARAARAR
jgi:acyl-CoA synthetase (AMP-forming)/AMP-acid ligase II